MKIAVESKGPVTNARAALATLIAKDTFLPLARSIRSVTLHVPSTQEKEQVRACEITVMLADGRSVTSTRTARFVADALESAAHAARRDIYYALGHELPRREKTSHASSRFERRAG